MLRHWLIFLVCALLIPAGILSASDTGHGSDNEASGGIFDGDIFTAIFTVVLFLLILVVLGKWAWGPILDGLQKREEYIRQSIEEAGKSRQDAEKALQEYKDQLATAQDQSKEIIDKGKAAAVMLAEKMKENAQEEAKLLRDQANQDINYARNQAVKEIHAQATDLATDLAGKIIGKTLNPDDHRTLLEESLDKLQDDN